jgi:hypothetical protein
MPRSGVPTQISDTSLYQGLRAIWDTEFPKTCPKCHRVFHSFEEYLVDTRPLPHSSGLMGYKVGDPGEQVGLFRNCGCGTTVMAFCHDRRDLSESGNKRRELFGELMNRLIANGISTAKARKKLLQELSKAPDEAAFRKALRLPPQ